MTPDTQSNQRPSTADRLADALEELLRMYCLVQKCELGHPCPERISTLQPMYQALAAYREATISINTETLPTLKEPNLLASKTADSSEILEQKAEQGITDTQRLDWWEKFGPIEHEDAYSGEKYMCYVLEVEHPTLSLRSVIDIAIASTDARGGAR